MLSQANAISNQCYFVDIKGVGPWGGGPYGGNAVACAAAVATIEVLRDEKLVENAAVSGEQLILRRRHWTTA